MKICYYDESGDDGFPTYSSPLFVLSVLYLDHLAWKDVHSQIVDFRRLLKLENNFPVKTEMHTKQFLQDKHPYRGFGFTPDDRLAILTKMCRFVGSLNIRIVNVLINKTVILHQGYDVLNNALKYSIQRIENDIDPQNNPDVRFLVITDEGRVGKMRRTTRAIQRINFIPSRFGTAPRRQEIQAMIEDPLPKDSKESYFIQIADLVAYLVYLYGIKHLKIANFPNRIANYLTDNKLTELLELLKPAFNLQAAPKNEFGIKIHPE